MEWYCTTVVKCYLKSKLLYHLNNFAIRCLAAIFPSDLDDCVPLLFRVVSPGQCVEVPHPELGLSGLDERGEVLADPQDVLLPQLRVLGHQVDAGEMKQSFLRVLTGDPGSEIARPVEAVPRKCGEQSVISSSSEPQALRIRLAVLLQQEPLLAEDSAALPAQAVHEQGLPEELQQAGKLPAGVDLLQAENVGVVLVDHRHHSLQVANTVRVNPAVDVVGSNLEACHAGSLHSLPSLLVSLIRS